MVNTKCVEPVQVMQGRGGGLPLASLNHISVVCRSLESSLRFYRDVLGFIPIRRPGSFDFDGSWLFNYGIGIHLLQAEDPESMPPKKTEINPKDNHISFQCESMEAVQRQLKELGVRYVQRRVEEGGIYVDQLFFHDPDGFMVEVCTCDNLPVVPLVPISGGAALPCTVCTHHIVDMTGVLPHQGGADDSNLNHQAHAQVADNDDGPPPVPINNSNQADETTGDLMKMAKWLFGMGFGTLTMSLATALYKAPRGVVFERYKTAYYGMLAVTSVCGMAEVAVAFCVSRCRRFVRVVLCASVAPFATVVALGGFSVVMKG